MEHESEKIGFPAEPNADFDGSNHGFGFDLEDDGVGGFGDDFDIDNNAPIEENKEDSPKRGNDDDDYEGVFQNYGDNSNENEDIDDGIDFFGEPAAGKDEMQQDPIYPQNSIFENINSPNFDQTPVSKPEANLSYLTKMKEELKTTLRGLIKQKEAQKEEQDKVIKTYEDQVKKISTLYALP